MNTNKIFRIFAKDLQTNKDKKFVGVVETVPPNNVITLTVPTLKKAFVFSAHDPMGVSLEGTAPLCVKFTGTLTDGTGPGEDQNFLFFFSTEIKVKAFIAEANKLIEAAKNGARGSTEKAVIRRNSLINSEGKLKTGKLLKRFTKAMSAVKVIRNDTVSQELEPRAEESVSEESEETSEEEETSESEGEEEVSLKEEKPSKESIPDPPAPADLAEPAAETPQSVAQEDSEDDESDAQDTGDHQQAPVPPVPAQTQGKTKSEDQTRKESMDHFLAAASVMVDAERGAKKASPTTEPSVTRAAPISSTKAKQSLSLDSQISEEGSRSSSPQRDSTVNTNNSSAPTFTLDDAQGEVTHIDSQTSSESSKAAHHTNKEATLSAARQNTRDMVMFAKLMVRHSKTVAQDTCQGILTRRAQQVSPSDHPDGGGGDCGQGDDCVQPTSLRVGVHTGSCVSGIVGTRNLRFCILGESVSIAAKLEQSGRPDMIHASATVREMAPKFHWKRALSSSSAGWFPWVSGTASSAGEGGTFLLNVTGESGSQPM